MEITLPKIAMVLVAVLVVAGGGGWAWSSATMSGRFAAVRNESMQIGYARGGRIPTDALVRTQVEGIAAAHRVTLSELTVRSHTEQGLGRATSLAPQLGAALSGTLRVFEIRATATTSELLWSRTEPIDVRLNLRTSVTLRGPSDGTGSVRPDIRPPGVSTDVHGGVGLDDYAIER